MKTGWVSRPIAVASIIGESGRWPVRDKGAKTMQERKDNEIVKAQEGEIQKLAVVERGDEFEIKGLKFRITKKHSRGRITAKLIGM